MVGDTALTDKKLVTLPLLKTGTWELSKPFIGLGFDHQIIHGRRETEERSMGELWGLEHICRYGRPL
jgi:hypothetical protein